MKPYLYIIVILLGIMPLKAQTRVSLLTCGAGEDIYTLFGHTAIRYEDPSKGIDAVFNYGLFDFNTPNFVLRFALGQTDYLLGMTRYENFIAEYRYYGREVRQQTLNLTTTEKQRLIKQLEENYRPENRVYRYNFFYDNCATRPRDQVERAVEGHVDYRKEMNQPSDSITWRHLLHRYTQGHPWARFGFDLCMGSETDKPVTPRQRMFVPFYLKECFDHAVIVGDTVPRALVSEKRTLLSPLHPVSESIWDTLTPFRCAMLLLISTILLSIYGIRKRRSLWGIDLLLYLSFGLAGCILTFLAFFSQHPCVGHNWLLWVFHPLHLLCLPCMLRRVVRKQKSRYQAANAVILTLFILFWALIPQRIPLTVLPLALCLLVRALSNVVISTTRASIPTSTHQQ